MTPKLPAPLCEAIERMRPTEKKTEVLKGYFYPVHMIDDLFVAYNQAIKPETCEQNDHGSFIACFKSRWPKALVGTVGPNGEIAEPDDDELAHPHPMKGE